MQVYRFLRHAISDNQQGCDLSEDSKLIYTYVCLFQRVAVLMANLDFFLEFFFFTFHLLVYEICSSCSVSFSDPSKTVQTQGHR